MTLEQIYNQEELRSHFAANYCDNYYGALKIIDRFINLGATAAEIDTLLASAHERGMKDAR